MGCNKSKPAETPHVAPTLPRAVSPTVEGEVATASSRHVHFIKSTERHTAGELFIKNVSTKILNFEVGPVSNLHQIDTISPNVIKFELSPGQTHGHDVDRRRDLFPDGRMWYSVWGEFGPLNKRGAGIEGHAILFGALESARGKWALISCQDEAPTCVIRAASTDGEIRDSWKVEAIQSVSPGTDPMLRLTLDSAEPRGEGGAEFIVFNNGSGGDDDVTFSLGGSHNEDMSQVTHGPETFKLSKFKARKVSTPLIGVIFIATIAASIVSL